MEYCPECKYPIDEDGKCLCASVCPCGCNNDHRLTCTYDTPAQRHLKNLINGVGDEQWVIDGLKPQSMQANEPYVDPDPWTLKRFEAREIREAIEYAQKGGQALHVHNINAGHPLFRRYPVIAHLFDQDKIRLIYTARKLGVKVIKVGREGERGQHIDLCGKPFERACMIAAAEFPLVRL